MRKLSSYLFEANTLKLIVQGIDYFVGTSQCCKKCGKWKAQLTPWSPLINFSVMLTHFLFVREEERVCVCCMFSYIFGIEDWYEFVKCMFDVIRNPYAIIRTVNKNRLIHCLINITYRNTIIVLLCRLKLHGKS